MPKATRQIEKIRMRDLAEQLRDVPEGSRKLLAHIIDLAYHGRGEGREQDTVYFPELHESCGLDVEAMYETLKPLQSTGLIKIENQYPFEAIVLATADPSGGNVLAELARQCEQAGVNVRDVVVDSQWNVLE